MNYDFYFAAYVDGIESPSESIRLQLRLENGEPQSRESLTRLRRMIPALFAGRSRVTSVQIRCGYGQAAYTPVMTIDARYMVQLENSIKGNWQVSPGGTEFFGTMHFALAHAQMHVQYDKPNEQLADRAQIYQHVQTVEAS